MGSGPRDFNRPLLWWGVLYPRTPPCCLCAKLNQFFFAPPLAFAIALSFCLRMFFVFCFSQTYSVLCFCCCWSWCFFSQYFARQVSENPEPENAISSERCECECAFKARLLSIHACPYTSQSQLPKRVAGEVGCSSHILKPYMCIHTHSLSAWHPWATMSRGSWNWYCCTLCLCRIIIVAYHG